MSIACGKDEFLGTDLITESAKVLFISLEEFWLNKVERNIGQKSSFSKDEQVMIKSNFLFQKILFPSFILTNENWELLNRTIEFSGAKTVFIDSITRMVAGDIESSKEAERVMHKLREIAYDNEITLFAIHHTPKMKDEPLTIDKIKGSAVFAQEADFAIGVNRTSTFKQRYIKEVIYRYANDDIDTVEEFEINDNFMINVTAVSDEMEVIQRTDRRRANDSRDLILKHFDENPDATYPKHELVEILKPKLKLQERQIETYISELTKNSKILSPKRGYYTHIKNVQENESV